jgi:quinoprotein glucose dehydrogenase
VRRDAIAGRLRGRLHAALDDGGDARRAGDLASFNGKLLRLNADGTTPADQVAATPVSASGFRSPRGIDWHPGTGSLWIVDEESPRRASLRAIGAGPSGSGRRTIEAAHALLSGASALVFYRSDRIAAFRGNLFIAVDEGRHLLRLRLAAQDPLRVESAKRLLDGRVGGVRAVGVGPDGAVYFCTAGALARLVPEWTSARISTLRHPVCGSRTAIARGPSRSGHGQSAITTAC